MKNILASVVVLAAFAAASLADQSHYQRYVVGTRAAGMGGVAVAGGDGVDATFYNPAGLAGATHDSLSLSGNLYGLQRYQIKGGLSATDNAKSDAFVSIPSTMGGVWRIDDRLTASFSLFQPNRLSTGEITSKDGSSRLYSYSTEDQSIWFGPAVAYQLTDKLSLGLSLFGVYSSYKNSETSANVPENTMSDAHMQYDNTAILGVIGAQWALPYDWRVGLSIQTPGLSVAHDGKLSTSITEKGELFTFFSDDLNTKDDIPMKIALGIARQRPKDYGYGIDVTYHPANSQEAIDMKIMGEDVGIWIRRRDVIDVNLGGEYYILGKFPVRAGFYTSFSAVKEIERIDSLATSDIDLYGLTCSIGYEKEHTAINVGLSAMYGDGEDIGQVPSSEGGSTYRRSDATTSQILLTLSTSYFF